MPEIRRERIPAALMLHLLQRVREREIGIEQLALFADWAKANPEVPSGKWFKRFPEMTVCGEGELVKTFLGSGRSPTGRKSPDGEAWVTSFAFNI